MRRSLPPQIVRLVILTVSIVGLYWAARLLLTPQSWGEYGWYRGDALHDVAAREPVLAGMTACDECHADEIETLLAHEHKTLSCETCHGPSRPHVDDPDIKTAEISKDFCLRCHEFDPVRPEWMAQIDVDDHYEGDSCAECHIPHNPNEIP